MASALAAKLAKVKANYKAAQKLVEEGGSGDFQKLEPGSYVGRVMDGEVNESQKGRLQAFLELVPTEGESKGVPQRKYYGFDRPEGIAALIRDFARMGQEAPADITEVEDAIKELVRRKPTIKFRVRENGEYTNVFIDKALLGEDAPEENGAEPEAAAEATAEEVEAASGDDNDVQIVPGLRVEVDGKGEGTIKSVDEDSGEITVKLASGKVVVIDIEKLSLPPAKPAKKPLTIKKR